jgi:acetyl esterase/lipase
VNKAQLVFKAVDIIGNPLQNNFHFENVLSVRDIAYGSEKLNKGDLYYIPEILNDGKKHPLVLYYHGGGFVMGDKKCRISISEFYANEGYFVFCVNYRLPPEVDFPAYFEDCIAAANYINILAES